jgi:phosphoadenosine phosphosulfate reductase
VEGSHGQEEDAEEHPRPVPAREEVRLGKPEPDPGEDPGEASPGQGGGRRRRLISDALELLHRARRELGPTALIGLSGGKDSLAVLDLAAQVFDHVACFHLAIVPDLACVEGRARQLAARYGTEVRTYPHPDAIAWLRAGLYCVPRGAPPPPLRHRDVELAARLDAGADVVILGEREDDSVRRRLKLRRWGQLHVEKRRCYPIAPWREREVYAYLRLRKIPLPVRFGERRMSGIDMTPDCMAAIRDRFPEDFARICEVFPHARALALKRDLERA